MPVQPPRFGRPTQQPRKPWALAGGQQDRRLRGREGVKLRQRIRAEEPMCRACAAEGRLRATTQIDHIVPLSRGGTDTRSNLQGLCDDCHDAKSAAERADDRRADRASR